MKIRQLVKTIGLLGLPLLFIVQLTSCKDHQAPAKPNLSFSKTTMTVIESDGDIEVPVRIDRAYSKDITIDYSLSGTAIEKLAADQTHAADYEVVGDYGQVEIKKGDTTGIIKLTLYSDFSLENDEIIDISIESVDDDNVEITRNDEIKITVKQEDGMLVLLEWDDSYTDVDMDLFLWYGTTKPDLHLTNVISANASHAPPEFLFLPDALDDGFLGFSYNYYEGSPDPMHFKVSFVKIEDEVEVSTAEYEADYTAANLNAWDQASGTDPVLAQSCKKVGGVWSNFTDITVPTNGSRTQSGHISPDLKKDAAPMIYRKPI